MGSFYKATLLFLLPDLHWGQYGFVVCECRWSMFNTCRFTDAYMDKMAWFIVSSCNGFLHVYTKPSLEPLLHYLIVQSDKFREMCIKIPKFFILQHADENAVCTMEAILFRPECFSKNMPVVEPKGICITHKRYILLLSLLLKLDFYWIWNLRHLYIMHSKDIVIILMNLSLAAMVTGSLLDAWKQNSLG